MRGGLIVLNPAAAPHLHGSPHTRRQMPGPAGCSAAAGPRHWPCAPLPTCRSCSGAWDARGASMRWVAWSTHARVGLQPSCMEGSERGGKTRMRCFTQASKQGPGRREWVTRAWHDALPGVRSPVDVFARVERHAMSLRAVSPCPPRLLRVAL